MAAAAKKNLLTDGRKWVVYNSCRVCCPLLYFSPFVDDNLIHTRDVLSSISLWALCSKRSHGTKCAMLESKLRTGTSKTKKMQICLDVVALFWMSQWTACSPAWRILYHVTASCKGPICFVCGGPNKHGAQITCKGKPW